MNIIDGSDAERESAWPTSASVAWAGQFEAGRQGAAQISARWTAPGAVCVGEALRAQGTVPSRITRDGAVLGHGCFSAQKVAQQNNANPWHERLSSYPSWLEENPALISAPRFRRVPNAPPQLPCYIS